MLFTLLFFSFFPHNIQSFGSPMQSQLLLNSFISPAQLRSLSASSLFSRRKTFDEPKSIADLESIIADSGGANYLNYNVSLNANRSSSDMLVFPEMQDAGIDEKALRASPFGKILFGVLEAAFPVFKEPNWFDIYDPPLTAEENLALPYFDGYDFVNSSWTMHIRHRYGIWNWLDRIGLVPLPAFKVFLREDGKTVWSDGFYGDWFINPAINYLQIEKHYGRGFGYTQYSRGIRVFQIQRWNFEPEVGRYWNRGLRSYLRNETNYWAFEGRVWGIGVKWRPFSRDQGKFVAVRDGTNLTAVFGNERDTPWEERMRHAMSLPFYQAHPDQLERIEDNFDYFYRNLLGREIR